MLDKQARSIIDSGNFSPVSDSYVECICSYDETQWDVKKAVKAAVKTYLILCVRRNEYETINDGKSVVMIFSMLNIHWMSI